MRKLSFVLLALAAILNNASLHAQSLSDGREIPLDPEGPEEGSPVIRDIITHPLGTYGNNNEAVIILNENMFSIITSIIDTMTKMSTYSRASLPPMPISVILSINVCTKRAGKYSPEKSTK